METFFSYETATHTLVLTGYLLLLMFDIWWIGYLIVSGVKWVVKKIKGRIQKKQPEESAQAQVCFRKGGIHQ